MYRRVINPVLWHHFEDTFRITYKKFLKWHCCLNIIVILPFHPRSNWSLLWTFLWKYSCRCLFCPNWLHYQAYFCLMPHRWFNLGRSWVRFLFVIPDLAVFRYSDTVRSAIPGAHDRSLGIVGPFVSNFPRNNQCPSWPCNFIFYHFSWFRFLSSSIIDDFDLAKDCYKLPFSHIGKYNVQMYWMLVQFYVLTQDSYYLMTKCFHYPW